MLHSARKKTIQDVKNTRSKQAVADSIHETKLHKISSELLIFMSTNHRFARALLTTFKLRQHWP